MYRVGIVAEYDPFHNGHAAQLRSLKEKGAGQLVVAMGSCCAQRGGFYRLSEAVRVRAALRAGADMVICLPAPYSGSGAEAFAAAGVRLLSALGCDTLSFGAETADSALLLRTAKALEQPQLLKNIASTMENGLTYAAARQQLLCEIDPEAAELLSLPNNILGVEYCKAILRQGSAMEPFALPRLGSGHGEEGAVGEFASGTALRGKPVEQWEGLVPEAALPLYKQAFAEGAYTDESRFDIALLSRLRGMSLAELGRIRGLSEGIENRLFEALRQASDYSQLLELLKTRRYPLPRLRRLCMDAALGYKADLPPLPPYIHVLGAKKEALPLLKQAELPAGTSLADLEKANAACAAVAAAQNTAADLKALCQKVPLPMGEAYRAKPIIVE